MTETTYLSPSLQPKQSRECFEVLRGLLREEERVLAVYPSKSVSFQYLIVTQQRVFGLDVVHKKNPAKAVKREVQADDIKNVPMPGLFSTTLQIERLHGLIEEYGNLPRGETHSVAEWVRSLNDPDALAALPQQLLDEQTKPRAPEFLGVVKQHFEGVSDVWSKRIWVSGSEKGARELKIWRNRVVTDEGDVFVIDHEVQATVDTAGAITRTTRPSPIGMFFGAALPGSAVVPGWFLARNEKHDDRELYLAIEHPTWAIAARVDPKKGRQMRQIATAINQEARRQAALNVQQQEMPSADTETPKADTVVAQLEALANLHRSGALTDDEFARAKTRLLGE